MKRDLLHLTIQVEGANRAGEAVVRMTGSYLHANTVDVETVNVLAFHPDPHRLFTALRRMLERRAQPGGAAPTSDGDDVLTTIREDAGLATVGEEESTQ